MRPFSAFSIRAKLIAIVMITTCAALALVAGALAAFDAITHRQTMKKDLQTMAEFARENSTAALTFENAADARDVLGAFLSQPEVMSACLYQSSGDLFASYVQPRLGGACPAHPRWDVSGFRGDSLIVYQLVPLGGEHPATLRLEASVAQLHRRVRLFGLVLVVVVSGSLLAAFALSSRLQRVVSRPILELASTARQISAGRDYALRAPQWTDDEIGVAVAAFNQMLGRIQEADKALRSLNATLEQRVAERTAAAEERAAALKRSNEELEQFAYVASHDLQEPLRAISSYAQLVERRTGGQLGEDVDLYVRHLIGGASRMRALINDLLEFSRVGRQKPHRVPVDVDAVLGAVLDDLAAGIAEQRAQVTRGPLPTVWADRGQLTQVLTNLISNAIRFRGEAEPVIHVRAERLADRWRFSVRDNGIGIEARHLERVFIIFQRLHGRERPGTGIGLAICRKIVAAHGGTIWAESEPGRGSTFFFTFPLGPSLDAEVGGRATRGSSEVVSHAGGPAPSSSARELRRACPGTHRP
jgi:signal transduction histidine kinase